MAGTQSNTRTIDEEGVVCNLLAFRINKQNFSLSLEPILQIVPMVSITPIPQVDSSILGVINLRGKPVPVIDLAQIFGYPKTVLKIYTPIVFVFSGGRTFGLVVDEVSGVVNLADNQVIPLQEIFPAGVDRTPLLKGLAQLPEGMFPLIDLEQIFSCENILAVTQSLENLPEVLVVNPEAV